MKLHRKLLTDAQRKAAAEKLHKVRVKRLVVGSVLIVSGTLLPDFHPHFASMVAADAIKTVGYMPIVKLIEEIFIA